MEIRSPLDKQSGITALFGALAAGAVLITALALSDIPAEEQGLTADYNNNSNNSFVFEIAEKI